MLPQSLDDADHGPYRFARRVKTVNKTVCVQSVPQKNPCFLSEADFPFAGQRSRHIDQQKKRRHLLKKLIKQGVPPGLAISTVFSNNGRWSLSRTFALHSAYPNKWFIGQLGQWTRSGDKLKHWFGIRRWIRVA